MSTCFHHEWVGGEEVVSPDYFTCSFFLGLLLGLPCHCLLPLPSSLWAGEGTVAKSGAFPYLPEPPLPPSLEDEVAEGSPHLPSECLSGLQFSFSPSPTAPSLPHLSSSAPLRLLHPWWGPHSTLTMAAEYQGLLPKWVSL